MTNGQHSKCIFISISCVFPPFQEIDDLCMPVRDDEESELEFHEEILTGSSIQHLRRQVNVPS